MAKRESIVPGLGKQQAKVFNNEEGRRAEHKRHLEELGFPKEVDAAFMRYAPVSYDDETPYPSKVVNQAGEDLGFTPKDSLMKSDIQSIVKEAVQEVFISKQPDDEYLNRFSDTRFGKPVKDNTRDKFPSQYADTPDAATFDVREEARKRGDKAPFLPSGRPRPKLFGVFDLPFEVDDDLQEKILDNVPTQEDRDNLSDAGAHIWGALNTMGVFFQQGGRELAESLKAFNNIGSGAGLVVP